MSQALQISDDAYNTLRQMAADQRATPEAIIEALIARAASDERFETEAWFHHLGMSDEMIEQAKELAEHDADA